MRKEKIFDILLPYQQAFVQDSRRRKLWVSSRQIGKSFAVAFSLVHGALAGGKLGLSLCISTGQRAASEIIKKCTLFADAVSLATHRQLTFSASYDKIVFSNGARVISLPSSQDGSSLRGWTVGPYGVLAIDEAAYIPHLEEIMQAIAPTLTRNPTATLMLTSTPAGKNSKFYHLWTDALESDEWFTQQTTIHDAAKAGLQVNVESLRSLCPDPEKFAIEYECSWDGASTTLFDLDLLKFTDQPPSAGKYVFGMDIGRKSDRTAIAVLKVAPTSAHLQDIIVLDKMPYAEQKAHLAALKSKWSFAGGYIDAGGIGNAFAEDIQRTLDTRYRGFTFTGANKSPLYENLRARVFDSTITFDQHLKDLLIQDFTNVARLVNDAGVVRYVAGHSSSGHSDCTSAIVLALQAAKDFKTNSQLPTQLAKMPTAFGYGYGSRF